MQLLPSLIRRFLFFLFFYTVIASLNILECQLTGHIKAVWKEKQLEKKFKKISISQYSVG